MIAIGNTLVSEELIEEAFVCDLEKCKGACCVAGDAGAPLEDGEKETLERIYPDVKPYMTEDGIRTVEQHGLYVYDKEDKEYVTTLIVRDKKARDLMKKSDDPAVRARANQKECAFTIFEGGIAKCSIEKAWKEGKVDFRKPVSCHLYPVRISRHKGYEAVNYNRWSVCSAACTLGKALKVPVFEFVREALTRKYGTEWVNQLSVAAKLHAEGEKERA